MTARSHTISLPNFMAPGTHELVFYDWGNVDATKTVVCVHGLTRNAHDFAPLAETLAATGRRVFSLNMAGRGESAWLADANGYNYGAYVADCLAVMDNFHLRGVEWIGTSMGGIIGMMIAANNPGRIRKLVLNDIGSFLSAESLRRIFTYVSAMPKQFTSRQQASDYLRETYASFGITDPQQWEQFVDASLISHADGTLRYACDPAIMDPVRATTQNFTEVHDVNLASVWEEVDIPTYILHGAESDVLSRETVSAMRSTNPHAESITLPGIGHAPALLSAEQIGLVTNWLNRPSAHMLAAGM